MNYDNIDLLLHTLFLVPVLAFLVERVLAIIFESPIFIKWYEDRKLQSGSSVKPVVATILSVAVTLHCEIDLLMAIKQESVGNWFGYLMTGLLVSSGSKASIKLFRDVLNLRSTVYQEYKDREFDRKNQSPIPESLCDSDNTSSCLRPGK